MRTGSLLIIGLLLCGTVYSADESTSKPATPAKVKMKKQAAKSATPPTAEEREELAMEFVKEHHPELAEILAGLKESRRHEYQRGLREIQTVSQRISKFREKQPERYNLEVEVWKAGSRARLLAAQGAMNDAASDELKEKIKTELLAQEQAQLKLLEFEQAELQKRLETVQNKLKMSQDELDMKAAEGAEKLLSSANKQRDTIEKRKEIASKRKMTKSKTPEKEEAKKPETTKDDTATKEETQKETAEEK